MSGLVLIATRTSSGELLIPCIAGNGGGVVFIQCSLGSAGGHATIVSAVGSFPDTSGSAFEAQRELVAFVTTHKHLNDFRPSYHLTHRYCHLAGDSGVRAFSRGSGSPLSPFDPFISQKTVLNQPRPSPSSCKVLVPDHIYHGTI
jgi:hypothetical protein